MPLPEAPSNQRPLLILFVHAMLSRVAGSPKKLVGRPVGYYDGFLHYPRGFLLHRFCAFGEVSRFPLVRRVEWPGVVDERECRCPGPTAAVGRTRDRKVSALS